MEKKIKDYSDTYLYNLRRREYEDGLFDYISHAHRIDKSDPTIQDLRSMLKMQNTSNYFDKVFMSPNTILCINERALPRAFKVMVAKDPKANGTKKLFIDCTGVIYKRETGYTFSNRELSVLVAEVLAGAHNMLYYMNNDKVINKNAIIEAGCDCFSKLVFYIADYLRLTSDMKSQGLIKYYATKYFQLSVMGKDLSESVENRALKIGGISDREAMMLNDIILAPMQGDKYKDFASMVDAIKCITKSTLTKEAFLDKWMMAIGKGTQFSLEVYPAFTNMMVHAYIGDGMTMQKTIEKVVGRDMIEYFTAINQLGGELI